MKQLTADEKIVKKDILRYKTNKFPAMMALVAIVFNCLYFCLLYGFKNAFFSQWEIGISVMLTLIILLVAFLSSEGIKNYKKMYCIVLLVLAAVQIIRIFGLPLQALTYDKTHTAVLANKALYVRYFFVDLTPELAYTLLLVWLVASAACFVVAAVFGYINCMALEGYKKDVESGKIVVEDVLKKLDAEEEAAAEEAKAAEAEAYVAPENEIKIEVEEADNGKSASDEEVE